MSCATSPRPRPLTEENQSTVISRCAGSSSEMVELLKPQEPSLRMRTRVAPVVTSVSPEGSEVFSFSQETSSRAAAKVKSEKWKVKILMI